MILTKEQQAYKEEREAAMLAFEKATSDWGFEYDKIINADEGFPAYEDYATGISFGAFLMGWKARGEFESKD